MLFRLLGSVRPAIRTVLTRRPKSGGTQQDHLSSLRFKPTGLAKPEKPKGSWNQFFLSEQGKKRMMYLSMAITFGLGFAEIFPHTFGQSIVREIYQHHSMGDRLPTTKDMQQLAREVYVDCNLQVSDVENVTLAVTSLMECKSLGTFSSYFGSLVMYPQHFHYKDKRDVKLNKMGSLTGKLIKPSPENKKEQELLRESLVLSESAKKFALAREVQQRKTGFHRVAAIQNMTLYTGAFLLSRLINQKLNLYAVHRMLRLLNYSAVGLVLGLAGVMLRDAEYSAVAGQADEFVCGLGAEYCAGGVEYYDKILKRHIAIRTLMPEIGQRQFTLKGDFFPGLIRTKTRPITIRKETCLKIMNEKYNVQL